MAKSMESWTCCWCAPGCPDCGMCLNHCDWIGCQKKDPPPHYSPPPTPEIFASWLLHRGTIEDEKGQRAAKFIRERQGAQVKLLRLLEVEVKNGRISLPLEALRVMLALGM